MKNLSADEALIVMFVAGVQSGDVSRLRRSRAKSHDCRSSPVQKIAMKFSSGDISECYTRAGHAGVLYN